MICAKVTNVTQERTPIMALHLAALPLTKAVVAVIKLDDEIKRLQAEDKERKS